VVLLVVVVFVEVLKSFFSGYGWVCNRLCGEPVDRFLVNRSNNFWVICINV
jgi:hypothetical protein